MTHVTAAARSATTHQAATAATTAARTDGASFAAVHTAAVKDAEGTDTTASTTKAPSSASAAPKGERTEKVSGHQYAEIVAGPRNGMFLNDTGNARDGEAFLIVKRAGREFHIYGTGDDRTVYEVGRERDATPATGSTGASASGTSGASTTG